LLAVPLLTRVHERFPGIVLHIFDSFGITLSELMLKRNGLLRSSTATGL